MRKKKLLFTLTAVALLLIASCLIATASAKSTAKTPYDLKVQSRTLLLEDSVYIRYYVPVEGTNGADVKMIFWLEPQDEYVYGTQDYTLSPNKDTVVSGSAEYYIFDFKELAAKQMTVDVYARIYVSDESGEHYGKLNKYGVLHYCYYMLGKTSTNVPDADFEDLLNSLLAYGSAAQKYFNENTSRPADADYYQIKVKNALLPDSSTSGLYLKGDEITVTAAATNEAGEEFLYWQNSAGTQMCNEQTYTITVGEQNETYTAVYGVKGPIATDASYFTFTELADGTYSIKAKDVNNMPAEVVIPATYNGKAVTSIDKYAFQNCVNITSITIFDNIKNVGIASFFGCKNLANVYITDLEAWCKIDFSTVDSNPMYNGANLYVNDEILTELNIPNSIEQIKYATFAGCTSIINVSVPSNVKSLGGGSFYRCTKLTNITISENTTHIGNMAFYGATSLENITIPNSVTSIGYQAFADCEKLSNIGLSNNLEQIGFEAFRGCSNICNITIPDSVRIIEEYTFRYCNSLNDIYYGGTATDWENISIGSNNTELTTATIYYYSETQPTTSGNYWHYVDGIPTAW